MKYYDLKFNKGDDVKAVQKIADAIDNGTDVTLTKEEVAGFSYAVGREEFSRGYDFGYLGMGISGLAVGGFCLIKRWIKNRRNRKKDS